MLVLPALCLGCAHQRHGDLNQFLHANKHAVSAMEYRIGIPDTIQISAPRIQEINGRGQVVQPNGKITLRLLGEVKIVGMTAKEIAAKLRTLAKPYYDDPKIHVRVTGYHSKKIYLFGEVGGPGPRPYTGRDTLLDVLSSSGLTFVAWRSQVQVIRPDPKTNEHFKIYVDVDKLVQGGDQRLNILLEPNDIVYVPPTPMGWLGYRIREVINPFTPVIRAYQFPAVVDYSTKVYSGGAGLTTSSTAASPTTIIR
ncbi:MAG: polysaccharide export protein [Planctomycetes bacterium]|nr:polysaccharide export protein [Planctomycetota bacterium]